MHLVLEPRLTSQAINSKRGIVPRQQLIDVLLFVPIDDGCEDAG